MTLQGEPCSWLLQSMFCFHLCLVKPEVFFFIYIYVYLICFQEKLAYFRIKELKDVLTKLGLSKQGKKQVYINFSANLAMVGIYHLCLGCIVILVSIWEILLL